MPAKPPKNAESDTAAWQAEISTVHPLGTRRTRPVQAPTPSIPYIAPIWAPRHIPLNILSNTAACLSGLAHGLPQALLKDLSRGIHSPTATLDLHGLREGDAWLRLMNWLHEAADHDHRCVLVVTGKGRGYGISGDMGLIKSQTAGWLAAHPKVQAFHSAQPHHGGQGAVYVYLKRRK